MAETLVTALLIAALIYLIAGVVFTVFFQWRGIHRIDEGTRGAGIGFRIIIIPGCMLFWPVLWKRWRNSIR